MTKNKDSQNITNEKTAKSLYEGNILTGKPLSEYSRKIEGATTTKEYLDELRTARQLTDKDYSIRINARG
jgi:hypothetical protein